MSGPGPERPVPLLCLEGVSKSYRTGSTVRSVLEDVGLTIRAGEKASLVGPSGSGKSTLLAVIAGLLSPDGGSIRIDGAPIEHLDESRRAALRAERVGVVLQSDNLIPFLTAAENVELATGFRRGGSRRSQAGDLLQRLDVAHRADHLPRQLSGGEAQRVAIAVALANAPDLLLADEVVGQLDSATAGRVADVLFDSDLAVLFVTHNPELANRAEHHLGLVRRTVVRR